MERSLQDILGADVLSSPLSGVPSEERDAFISKYLTHLSTLTLSALESEEAQSLAQASHSTLLALQALSTRSHRSIIESCDHVSQLKTELPPLAEDVRKLRDTIPTVEDGVSHFSQTYSKNAENPLLERRSRAMLLTRNVDRVSDILELPSLLSTAVSASNTSSAAAGTTATAGSAPGTMAYSSALDIYSHIKRLHHLYPKSYLVNTVAREAEECMRQMTTNIITNLKSPGLKLPAAIRMIGWLRRIAPDLDDKDGTLLSGKARSHEGGYGALVLVCRLGHLLSLLDALEPLRELADQETELVQDGGSASGQTGASESLWSSGQHTERYLKRYIEIFREQSFAIVSMYRSIFPAAAPGTQDGEVSEAKISVTPTRSDADPPSKPTPQASDPLQPLPSPLATFPLHLIELLMATLRKYLPNVRDRSARDSLMTQLLYCAASLGRLSGDFSLLLASLNAVDSHADRNGSVPWVEVVKKHRALAGRLDLLASGLAGAAKGKA